MCKIDKKDINELSEVDEILDEVKNEEETFTQEEVLELLNELSDTIEVDVEEVQGLKLDKEEFQRALDDMSYICGQITALKSVGCSTAMAFDYIVAKEGLAYMNITE